MSFAGATRILSRMKDILAMVVKSADLLARPGKGLDKKIY